MKYVDPSKEKSEYKYGRTDMTPTIAQQDGRNRERGVDPIVFLQSYDTVRLPPCDAQDEQIGQY